MNYDVEQLLEDIVSGEISTHDLSSKQLEEILDHIRGVFTDMLGTENNEAAEALLELTDAIRGAMENQSLVTDDWDTDIQASIDRGNTYFEMENYVVQ
jgi:hypothetical protein